MIIIIDEEVNPEIYQLWLSAIQILVRSEQIFVVFETKKIGSKSEDYS